MRISTLLNQPLALLGLGREGLASLAVFREAGHTGVVYLLGDMPPAQLPDACQYVPLADLAEVLPKLAWVIRSPGFAPHHPLRLALDQSTCQQTTATQIFLAEMRAADIQVIGITASKGKSTTSALSYAALQAAGLPSVLVGNIGQPALEMLPQMLHDAKNGDKPIVVMEMSSYQCDDLQPGYGPQLAAIGALFPEHLDYHGSLQAYFAAKLKIATSQQTSDSLVCHAQAWPQVAALGLAQAVEIVNYEAGLHFAQGWFYDGQQALFSDQGMRLPGLHNRANACIAYALVRRFGVTPAQMQSALQEFTGLPYRLQDEGIHAGIRWINDSISTAPEACAAALEALQGCHTLIAGGHERGYAPQIMVEAILQYAVREVILLPDTGAVIAACLAEQIAKRGADFAAGAFGGLGVPRVHSVETLAQAVTLAQQITPKGGSCLLSPGAPSYNAFSGFEARGREFRRCVEGLLG